MQFTCLNFIRLNYLMWRIKENVKTIFLCIQYFFSIIQHAFLTIIRNNFEIHKFLYPNLYIFFFSFKIVLILDTIIRHSKFITFDIFILLIIMWNPNKILRRSLRRNKFKIFCIENNRIAILFHHYEKERNFACLKLYIYFFYAWCIR